MNKCIFMGRLTRDPEIRYTDATPPTTIARYTLAVDRKNKKEGQPEADFFNMVAFGKCAEFTEKYLKKGMKMLVTAQAQNNNYTTKEGVKVYSVDFVVQEQEFAESKRAGQQEENNDGFMDIPDGADEQLPFN